MKKIFRREISRGICIKCNKVLLCKSKVRSNFFFIGGGIEQGETPEQALIREVFEETHLICSINNKIGIFDNKYAIEESKIIIEKIHLYCIYIDDDNIINDKISKEYHIDFFWKSMEEIKELSIKPDFLKPFLKNYDEKQ